MLQSKIPTAQAWNAVLPLPACVSVTPLNGTIPGNGATKLALKAVGKPGERGVISFVTKSGETVTLSVIIAAASDAGVVPKWSLVPSEGVSTGVPITIQIKNDASDLMKWKVGVIPKGVTVTPMNGQIPGGASFAVNIAATADVGSATKVVKIPFMSGGVTKNFLLTIQAPNPTSPTDLQSPR